MKKFTLAALAAAAFVSSMPANAAYLFSYNSLTNKNAQPTLSFQLDASPTPDMVTSGNFFLTSNVAGTTCTNSTCTPGTSDVRFYDSAHGGLFGGFGFDLYGLQAYTGTEANPTFTLGTYTVSNSSLTEIGSLVISDLGGAVPEAATWAMMIAGFGMVGAATRRRRTLAAA